MISITVGEACSGLSWCWLDQHEGAAVWLGALATFLAVVAAFVVQNRQIRNDRNAEARRKAEINVALMDAINEACDLVEGVLYGLIHMHELRTDKVWQSIVAMDANRRVLKHYLLAPIPLPGLVTLATGARLRLYEARATLVRLIGPSVPGSNPSDEAINTMRSIVFRLRLTIEELNTARENVAKDRRFLGLPPSRASAEKSTADEARLSMWDAVGGA
jgi:hypothetical protein